MAPWLVVWFVVGIVSTAAILACLIGLLRHLLVLGRTIRRFQEEARPIAGELAIKGRGAAERSAIGERRHGGTFTGPRR